MTPVDKAIEAAAKALAKRDYADAPVIEDYVVEMILPQNRSAARALIAEFQATVEALQAQVAELEAAHLKTYQRDNECTVTGKPCREPEKCGCWLEGQAQRGEG